MIALMLRLKSQIKFRIQSALCKKKTRLYFKKLHKHAASFCVFCDETQTFYQSGDLVVNGAKKEVYAGKPHSLTVVFHVLSLHVNNTFT